MTKRILVVEDDVDTARTIADALGEQGYDVQSVGTTADALERAAQWRPDLMVIDVGLPDGNGIHLAQALGTTRKISSIIVTGRSNFSLDEPLDSNPFVKYILFKPVSPRTLIKAVGEAISGLVPS